MGKTVLLKRNTTSEAVSGATVVSNLGGKPGNIRMVLSANPDLVILTGLEGVVRFILWTLSQRALEAPVKDIQRFMEEENEAKKNA